MTVPDAPTVRLSRLPSGGILLGLTAAQLLTLGVATVTIIAAVYLAGGTGLLVSAPVWVGAIVLAVLPVGGRPAVSWTPVTAVWGWRTLTGQRVYRRRLLPADRLAGLRLPGDAAALRAVTDPDTGAAFIHDPHDGRLVAVARLTHRSFVLLDPDAQHRRVQGWGRVLATACRSTRIARIQVLERTMAGSGSDLTRWFDSTGTPDTAGWASTTYADLIARAAPVAERHVTLLAVALDLTTAARPIRAAGGGLAGAARLLGQDMRSLASALAAADLGPVRWLDGPGLAECIRTAYDPHPIHPPTGRPARSVGSVGPVGVVEHWATVQSDSAVHAVLWIAAWPHVPVPADFLSPIVLAAGVTRSFSLILDPVPTGEAARRLRRRKTEHLADAAHRARIGQLEDAGQTAEYHDVLDQEAELTAGHGVLRYAGLLAISAPTVAELDAAVAQIEQAAIQASCDTRRLVGQQAQAFIAAALPVCRGI